MRRWASLATGTWAQVVAVLVVALVAALVATDVAALVAFGVPLTTTVEVAHPAMDAAMMAESSARARSCGAHDRTRYRDSRADEHATFPFLPVKPHGAMYHQPLA